MIRLSRLNGQFFFLNCDLIKTLEATPDSVITLTTGEKFVVLETVDEIILRVVTYRRRCRFTQGRGELEFEKDSEAGHG